MANKGLLQGGDACGSPVCQRVSARLHRGSRMTGVRSLAGGLEPLREWFNDTSAFVRLVAIQSPT
jgi:hypothetical protein